MTQCSADAGVKRSAGGGPEAIPCSRVASVEVEYRGVTRPLCAQHADSWAASRPDAVVSQLEEPVS